MKKEILIIVIFGILFLLPVLIFTKNLHLRLDSDYDSNLPVYYFVVESIRSNRSLPLWNPYVGTGIPVIEDPLSAVLNPFFIFPLVIFGVESGIRIVLFLTVIASGVSMWILLNSLRVNFIAGIWGAILYLMSGALMAQIASGHIEKFISYPVIPLFFTVNLVKSSRLIYLLLNGAILAYPVYSGDFYTLWFLIIFLISIKGYYFFSSSQKPKIVFQSFIILIFFITFSSVKLFPFIFNIYSNYERFFPINPYDGSIHFYLSPLAFLIPFQVEFYDRPFFQRLFGFHFNWYEYYAFITPLPFVFLLKIKKLLKSEHIKLFIFLIILGMLYASMKYFYSPIHWLYEIIAPVQSFRVPQRIFTPMTAVLIALLAICASYWLDKTKIKKEKMLIYGIFFLSIIWLFFIGQQTIYKTFEKPRKVEESIIKELKKKDNSNHYIVAFVCCTQSFLVREKIPVLNYYYGWRFKDSPNFINEKGDGYNYDKLKNVRPSYIIAGSELEFKKYSYYKFIENNKLNVWKTDKPNIFPKVRP